MNRIAPASLGFALAALAVAITAIVVCWTWLLVPCAAFTALALGCGILGWSHAAREPKRWYGRLWAGGALAIIFVGCWLILGLTAHAHGNERLRRQFAADQLKAIAQAMQAYFHEHGRIPPAAIQDKAGKPLLSWRVAVLAHLDPKLYARFKLDEPWDSPHNLPLLDEMPSFFAAPHRQEVQAPETVYQVFVGPGTPFDAAEAFQLPPTDLPIGPFPLLLIAEGARPVPWTKPEDLPYSPEAPLPPLGSIQRYALPPALFVPRPCRWMVAIDVLGMIREGSVDTTEETTMRRSIAN